MNAANSALKLLSTASAMLVQRHEDDAARCDRMRIGAVPQRDTNFLHRHVRLDDVEVIAVGGRRDGAVLQVVMRVAQRLVGKFAR